MLTYNENPAVGGANAGKKGGNYVNMGMVNYENPKILAQDAGAKAKKTGKPSDLSFDTMPKIGGAPAGK